MLQAETDEWIEAGTLLLKSEIILREKSRPSLKQDDIYQVVTDPPLEDRRLSFVTQRVIDYALSQQEAESFTADGRSDPINVTEGLHSQQLLF
jgi:hypothetical protein